MTCLQAVKLPRGLEAHDGEEGRERHALRSTARVQHSGVLSIPSPSPHSPTVHRQNLHQTHVVWRGLMWRLASPVADPSPCYNYVEELHWADKELQCQLNDDLEHTFQNTFKQRLAGLSSEAVLEWHEKYRALYSDQQSLYNHLYAGSVKRMFNMECFVNLKKLTITNGCEAGAEEYPHSTRVTRNPRTSRPMEH
ncbi:hypothetical protein VC83_04781 [Pseudogymnoascus destructans]|uniref:Uncharacterized protein n=2 Tax=Pseudogymnoascus destructans TaxID=655981 RepID=L8G038_PSED2|nr:uncharacterized protein VC83_04781 [Pseudogymnoascus destructans]ELR06600.1 hypothetical protein GMDG_08073 [Pseudogymnoascus destructans 20631-21]OAF57479.1 hypothetical protein VC83_04781 [Pseudogymnoascus destructans]